MNTKFTFLLELTLLLYLANTACAEGSKELMAGSCSNTGYIQIWDDNDSSRCFATYNCAAEHRLNIRVKDGDVIYFGYYNSNQDVYYRLKDPNGNIVMGPTLVKSSSSKGWISSCAKAITGPSNLYTGGYTPLSYTTTMAGDYYIEFAVDNSATTYEKRMFYFDITVVSGGVEAKGRIWSQDWDFTTDGTSNPFVANLYVYTTDSVVTEIEANGMLPYGFTISCNSTGASNVGTLLQMRKTDYWLDILSKGGTPGAPEYPIFLNDPDSTIFPTGSEGQINSIALSGCSSDSNCININVSQVGYVDVTLVFPNGGTTTQLPTQSVSVGNNCVSWSGFDASGNYQGDATDIQIEVTYGRGLTNLPIWDVENNLNGFKIALVRPTHDSYGNTLPTPEIFWDDSLLTDPQNSLDGVANLTGCTGGCHTWQNRGLNNSNSEVMNTWWYVTQDENTTTQGCSEGETLPITLINFTGEDSEHIVPLQWTMATQTQLNHFEIQRSVNGINFLTIGTQNVNKRSLQYHFNDTTVSSFNGILYYRLKMIDNNDNDTYSSVISVNLTTNNSNTITVFPNPNQGNGFSINLNGIVGSQITVKLFSIDGRLVTSLPVTTMGASEVSSQINLPQQLMPGLYIVECTGDNGVITSQMTVY